MWLSETPAFGSFAHLSVLFTQGIYGIFRAHQKLIVDFTPGRPHVPQTCRGKNRPTGLPSSRWIARLGPLDQIVEWFRPMNVPSWMSAEGFAALPETLRVRELRYQIARPWLSAAAR